MKIFYIIFLCSLFMYSCQKDLELDQQFSKSLITKVELSDKNKEILNKFTNDYSNKRGGQGPIIFEGMLSFESIEDVSSYYESLKLARKDFSLSEEEDEAFVNVSFPFDKLVNDELGFVSLRDHYDNITDYSSEGFESEIEDYIATPTLQCLLSAKKEIAIGGKIIKYMPMQTSIAIENLDIEGLQDARINGLGASHPSIVFYNKGGSTLSHLGPSGPGPDGPGLEGCRAIYRKNWMQLGVGDDANKVRFFTRAYHTGCAPGSNSILYKIEWGDGTSNTYYGGYINHTYPTPNFSIGECQTFEAKLTITFVKDCWPCKKGKQWVNNFSITICPIDDECTDDESYNSRSKVFKTFLNGSDYRLFAEIGIDNSIFVPFNWDRSIWARSTFYKEDGNSWKKQIPSGDLTARVYGVASYDDECLFPNDVDKEEAAQSKSVYVEIPSSFKYYTNKTSSEIMESDHSVKHRNDYHEILELPLWP